MTISGGSLCAGTCRLTKGRSLGAGGSVAPRRIRRRQRSLPRASQSSHRYAVPSSAAKTSRTHSSRPPTFEAVGMPVPSVQSSMKAR